MNNYRFTEDSNGIGTLQKQVQQPGHDPEWVDDMKSPVPFENIATKDYVRKKVAQANPDFKGTFNSMADIEALQNVDANDWAYLVTQDENGNDVYSRYRYAIPDGQTEYTWIFEVAIKRDNFTDEEWAAITSGVNADLIARLGEIDELVGDQVLTSLDRDNDGNVVGIYKTISDDQNNNN